jgi:hypothetical protein
MKKLLTLFLFFLLKNGVFAQIDGSYIKILNATDRDLTDICVGTRNFLGDNINWHTTGYYTIPRGTTKNIVSGAVTHIALYLNGVVLHTHNSKSNIYTRLPSVKLYRAINHAFDFRNSEKLDMNFESHNSYPTNLLFDKDKMQFYEQLNINRRYLNNDDCVELSNFYIINASDLGNANKIVISYLYGRYILEIL